MSSIGEVNEAFMPGHFDLRALAGTDFMRELLEADDTWDRLQCLDQLLRKDAPWVDQLAFHDQDNVWAGSPSAPNPAEGGSGLTLVALAICMWDHPHQGTADFGERLFRAAVGMVPIHAREEVSKHVASGPSCQPCRRVRLAALQVLVPLVGMRRLVLLEPSLLAQLIESLLVRDGSDVIANKLLVSGIHTLRRREATWLSSVGNTLLQLFGRNHVLRSDQLARAFAHVASSFELTEEQYLELAEMSKGKSACSVLCMVVLGRALGYLDVMRLAKSPSPLPFAKDALLIALRPETHKDVFRSEEEGQAARAIAFRFCAEGGGAGEPLGEVEQTLLLRALVPCCVQTWAHRSVVHDALHILLERLKRSVENSGGDQPAAVRANRIIAGIMDRISGELDPAAGRKPLVLALEAMQIYGGYFFSSDIAPAMQKQKQVVSTLLHLLQGNSEVEVREAALGVLMEWEQAMPNSSTLASTALQFAASDGVSRAHIGGALFQVLCEHTPTREVVAEHVSSQPEITGPRLLALPTEAAAVEYAPLPLIVSRLAAKALGTLGSLLASADESEEACHGFVVAIRAVIAGEQVRLERDSAKSGDGPGAGWAHALADAVDVGAQILVLGSARMADAGECEVDDSDRSSSADGSSDDRSEEGPFGVTSQAMLATEEACLLFQTCADTFADHVDGSLDYAGNMLLHAAASSVHVGVMKCCARAIGSVASTMVLRGGEQEASAVGGWIVQLATQAEEGWTKKSRKFVEAQYLLPELLAVARDAPVGRESSMTGVRTLLDFARDNDAECTVRAAAFDALAALFSSRGRCIAVTVKFLEDADAISVAFAAMRSPDSSMLPSDTKRLSTADHSIVSNSARMLYSAIISLCLDTNVTKYPDLCHSGHLGPDDPFRALDINAMSLFEFAVWYPVVYRFLVNEAELAVDATHEHDRDALGGVLVPVFQMFAPPIDDAHRAHRTLAAPMLRLAQRTAERSRQILLRHMGARAVVSLCHPAGCDVELGEVMASLSIGPIRGQASDTLTNRLHGCFLQAKLLVPVVKPELVNHLVPLARQNLGCIDAKCLVVRVAAIEMMGEVACLPNVPAKFRKTVLRAVTRVVLSSIPQLKDKHGACGPAVGYELLAIHAVAVKDRILALTQELIVQPRIPYQVKSISGREIMNGCDVFPSPRRAGTNHLREEDYSALFDEQPVGAGPLLVWVTTGSLIEFLDRIWPKVPAKTSVVLVTGGSDWCMPGELWTAKSMALPPLEQLLSDPRLVSWWTQNYVQCFPKPIVLAYLACRGKRTGRMGLLAVVPVEYEYKMHTFPAGVDFHTLAGNVKPGTLHAWGIGMAESEQERELKRVAASLPPFKDRPIKGYTNLLRRDKPGERARVEQQLRLAILSSSVTLESTPISRLETWKKHANYCFILSPSGSSLDCRRTWEALMLGCVPIVRSEEKCALFDGLPVIVVKSWTDVAMDAMKEWHAECCILWERNEREIRRKLTSAWWLEQMRSADTWRER